MPFFIWLYIELHQEGSHGICLFRVVLHCQIIQVTILTQKREIELVRILNKTTQHHLQQIKAGWFSAISEILATSIFRPLAFSCQCPLLPLKPVTKHPNF